MLRRDDRIRIVTDKDTEVYTAMCRIDAVKPDDVDFTAAGAEAAPKMKITLTYTRTLDPIIAAPSKYRFRLTRRAEKVDVISITKSRDLRQVVIAV